MTVPSFHVNLTFQDWVFEPNSISYSHITTDQTGQDYIGIYIGINGSGTQEDPFLVDNLSDFDWFAANSSYWATGVYTKLMTNIDLSGRVYSGAVIGDNKANSPPIPYRGIFDGKPRDASLQALNSVRADTLGYR